MSKRTTAEALDHQRPMVYRAEDESGWWVQGNHMPMDEIERLVRKISAWAGIAPPRVRDGRGARIARGRKDSLSLPRFARNASYVCHEMSHTIAAQLGMDDSHGPHFARIMLDVVARFVGREAAVDLRYHFRQRGVRISRRRWRKPAAA